MYCFVSIEQLLLKKKNKTITIYGKTFKKFTPEWEQQSKKSLVSLLKGMKVSKCMLLELNKWYLFEVKKWQKMENGKNGKNGILRFLKLRFLAF